MSSKRKREDEEKIRRKIRILENKLNKPSRRRVIIYSSSSEDESSSSRLGVSFATEHDERAGSPHPESLALSTAASPPESALEVFPEPTSATVEVAEDLALDDEILNLLGEPPKVKTSLGKNIHKEIALRWQELLMRGLTKESKVNICQEYLVPANCDLLAAPTLNPEAKAALTSFIIKRHHSLQENQQQIGTALAALSRATELLIAKETPEKVLKPLSDACRLLCDFHHMETKTRRNFVISAVKPELKDMLVNTTRDQFLFGENLSEQIKSAKNIQKSGEGLKATTKQPFLDKNKFIKNNSNQQKSNLNFKSSYRSAAAGRFEQGKPPALQQPQRASRGRQLPSQQRPRERSPPRRSCRK